MKVALFTVAPGLFAILYQAIFDQLLELFTVLNRSFKFKNRFS